MRKILFAVVLVAGCDKGPPPAPADTRSQGPATIEAPDVVYASDAETLKKGEMAFAAKGCPACHKIGGGKLVGPDLLNVTVRRHPRWIAKQILHPELMIAQDDVARELFKTHFTPMPNQKVDPATELGPIMSFLKSKEAAGQ